MSCSSGSGFPGCVPRLSSGLAPDDGLREWLLMPATGVGKAIPWQALRRRLTSMCMWMWTAMNLLDVINRGSKRLAIIALARDRFWFCPRHRVALSGEWVPREENSIADDISKRMIGC